MVPASAQRAQLDFHVWPDAPLRLLSQTTSSQAVTVDPRPCSSSQARRVEYDIVHFHVTFASEFARFRIV